MLPLEWLSSTGASAIKEVCPPLGRDSRLDIPEPLFPSTPYYKKIEI
jgi:hypothetical protein